MDIGHLFLLHEFLGCLYHLITWRGGFNSRLGPVRFGMDRNSQLAELLYWVCVPTLFIRPRLGPLLWPCVLGLCRCGSLPHR